MRKALIGLLLGSMLVPAFAFAQVPVDVCTNIAGDQAVVPEGYIEVGGECAKEESGGGGSFVYPCYFLQWLAPGCSNTPELMELWRVPEIKQVFLNLYFSR